MSLSTLATPLRFVSHGSSNAGHHLAAGSFWYSRRHLAAAQVDGLVGKPMVDTNEDSVAILRNPVTLLSIQEPSQAWQSNHDHCEKAEFL
jgi:hypothetical protein